MLGVPKFVTLKFANPNNLLGDINAHFKKPLHLVPKLRRLAVGLIREIERTREVADCG